MRHVVLALCILAAPVGAAEFTLPTATVARVEETPAGTVRLPEVPWTPGARTPATEGAITRTVLQVPNSDLTTLQLLAPLRTALREDGYDRVFSCADAECGGFDFRFQLDILGEPWMHVDLGDYRYVLMRKSGGSPHSVALVASRSGRTGFVHLTEVADAQLPEIEIDPTPPEPDAPAAVAEPPAPAPAASDIVATLTATGRAVLPDLVFETGSALLNDAPYPSLGALAAWMAENPAARIILVGHTDAVGSLEANTALSRQRAMAVSDRLTVRLGVDPARIQAAGAGYLAPMASNLTPEGRAQNRRVEVVLLSLD